jgi:phage terminase large subunit
MTDTLKKPRRARKTSALVERVLLAQDPILTGDAPVAPPPVAEPEAGAPDEQGEALRVPAPLLPLFTSTMRNIVIPGGRASGKSWAVAQYLVLRARERWERILCCRETQTSISASNKQLIEDTIKRLGLSDEFNVLNDSITHKQTGSEFIFSGLRDGGARIRSLEGATIAHVEESQQISRKSLETLIPTIRAPGSQLIFTLNPDLKTDAVAAAFLARERPDTLVLWCNYDSNPWCSDAIRAEAEWSRQVDQESYDHIWLGQFRTHAFACILAGKFEVRDFDTDVIERMPGAQALFGLDFTSGGASPQACIKAVYADGYVYVCAESYKAGVEADQVKTVIARDMPADILTSKIYCDAAAPATIAMLKTQRLRAEASPKWAGSVDDGIRFLRSTRGIVVHSSCKRFAEEARLWSWKVDARSDEILNEPKPGNDHGIDALRYALMGAGIYSKEANTAAADLARLADYSFAADPVTGELTRTLRPEVVAKRAEDAAQARAAAKRAAAAAEWAAQDQDDVLTIEDDPVADAHAAHEARQAEQVAQRQATHDARFQDAVRASQEVFDAAAGQGFAIRSPDGFGVRLVALDPARVANAPTQQLLAAVTKARPHILAVLRSQ